MESPYTTPAPEEHLLDDLGVQLVEASAGKRLANMLIDAVFFYVIIFLLAYTGGSTVLGILSTPFVIVLFLGLYYSIIEAIFKGKTLGKLITKTRAVTEDGKPITPGMAFGRGFSRLVPFEAFSAFGSPCYPWHDKWTCTYVVDEGQSRGIIL